MNRGRIEAPPITEEHVATAQRLFLKQPYWPTYTELAQRCRVPRARWWRFIEILNQRGIAAVSVSGVNAILGKIAGRTFEEFLAGACANADRFAAWRMSADPRPVAPVETEKRYG